MTAQRIDLMTAKPNDAQRASALRRLSSDLASVAIIWDIW